MKRYILFALFISLIISVSYVLPVSSASVKWISFPKFAITHLSVSGDQLLVGGITDVYDKIAGGEVHLIDMGYGSWNGDKLSITRWVPPVKDSYPPTLQSEDTDPILSIVKINDTIIVSTIHAYYIWHIGEDMPKDYGSGAGMEALAVYKGNVYGTWLNRVYKVDLSNGHLIQVAKDIPNLVDEYDLDIGIYGLAVYKDYLIAFGTGGIFFLQDDGNGKLKVVKYYLDKNVEGKYDIGDECINQNGYVVWDHYLILPESSFSFVKFVDLENENEFTADVPKSIFRITTDGTYVYGLTQRGMVFAFKPDASRHRLNIMWQYDFKKEATSIVAYQGKILVTFKDGRLAVISSDTQFSDVPTDYWAYDAIRYLASEGIVSGYPDGSFKPEKSVTRAEFAKMLATAMNLPLRCDDTLPEIYKDVHAGDWYCKYITPVVKAGYMKGYGGGRFGPNNKVKKEEILTTIVRIKKWQLITPEEGTFPDVAKNHWAYPYIETSVIHGLVKKLDPHITDGKFHLGVPATRAQTAVFMYRMMH